jgi:hypothetical protein
VHVRSTGAQRGSAVGSYHLCTYYRYHGRHVSMSTTKTITCIRSGLMWTESIIGIYPVQLLALLLLACLSRPPLLVGISLPYSPTLIFVCWWLARLPQHAAEATPCLAISPQGRRDLSAHASPHPPRSLFPHLEPMFQGEMRDAPPDCHSCQVLVIKNDRNCALVRGAGVPCKPAAGPARHRQLHARLYSPGGAPQVMVKIRPGRETTGEACARSSKKPLLRVPSPPRSSKKKKKKLNDQNAIRGR